MWLNKSVAMAHFTSYTEFDKDDLPYASWQQRDFVFSCFWDYEVRFLQSILEIDSQLYFVLELKSLQYDSFLLVTKINILTQDRVEFGSVRLKSIEDIENKITPYIELDCWEDIALHIVFPFDELKECFFDNFLGDACQIKKDALSASLSEPTYNSATSKFEEAVAYSADIDSIQSSHIFIFHRV